MSSGRFHQRLAAILCAALVSMLAGIAWSNERVIYVDAAATGAGDGSSWVDAYHDLQDALAEANGAAPAVIRVAQVGVDHDGSIVAAVDEVGVVAVAFHRANHAFELPRRGRAGGEEEVPGDVDLQGGVGVFGDRVLVAGQVHQPVIVFENRSRTRTNDGNFGSHRFLTSLYGTRATARIQVVFSAGLLTSLAT